MWCKNGAIKCDGCGNFCTPVDSETPFGAQGADLTEPLDQYDYCKDCAIELMEKWDAHFKGGGRSGYWMKSNAEISAASKNRLIWVGGEGIGKYGTVGHKMYQYVTKDEHKIAEAGN